MISIKDLKATNYGYRINYDPQPVERIELEYILSNVVLKQNGHKVWCDNNTHMFRNQVRIMVKLASRPKPYTFNLFMTGTMHVLGMRSSDIRLCIDLIQTYLNSASVPNCVYNFGPPYIDLIKTIIDIHKDIDLRRCANLLIAEKYIDYNQMMLNQYNPTLTLYFVDDFPDRMKKKYRSKTNEHITITIVITHYGQISIYGVYDDVQIQKYIDILNTTLSKL